jgi:putative oxidoreductase
MRLAKPILIACGGLSLAVALFQAVIVLSPAWSRSFGAPEALLANPLMLLLAGLFVAGVFVVWALYAFSGAGYLRPLPLLWVGLPVIGAIYTLRGLFIIPIVLLVIQQVPLDEPLAPVAIVSALVSLGIGLLYLAGVALADRRTRRQTAGT